MQFDGQTYRQTRSVIQVENLNTDYLGMAAFARVVPYGKRLPKNAELVPGVFWLGEKDEPVYAVRIKPKYHSLTNLMFDQQGTGYLAKDGKVFIRRSKKG